jgi:nucleoside phosphorylase
VVDVLIVTALADEYEAARRAAKAGYESYGGVAIWEERDIDSPTPYLIGDYALETGRSMSVALARPTRMGAPTTSPVVATLVERLKPKCLAMCGVCAGNPADVALGDVIVSEMVYFYDEGKRTSNTFEGDHRQIPMADAWVRAAQELRPDGLPSYGPASEKEAKIWLLERLYAGDQPRKHPARSRYFPRGAWDHQVRSFEQKGLIQRNGMSLILTEAGRSLIEERLFYNIDDPGKLPFEIKVGPIASGNVVVKDGVTWDQLRKWGVRSVLGLEMEAAAIGATALRLDVPKWIVAKGVMDHADPRKDDRYKSFAARASAEVLFKFLAMRWDLPGRKEYVQNEVHPVDGNALSVKAAPDQRLEVAVKIGSANADGSIAILPDSLAKSSPYVGQIRKFVQFYSGTTDDPKPFAGRDFELARLNTWLADENAEPNLLLTAPAGRGKSMLLVQWLGGLNAADLDLVFVPISLRYGTNRGAVFLEALAAQLAQLFGEVLPPPVHNPIDYFREQIAGMLARLPRPNRRCLVVVDGLDEATDGEIDVVVLPSHPRPGLRILISARLTALLDSDRWCNRIGWTLERANVRHETVQSLTSKGVKAVLEANGLVFDRTTRDAFVIELFRLTEGAPLLLQLYAETLAERRAKGETIRPTMLAGFKPGYAAYFEDWFRRQENAWKQTGQMIDDRWKAMLAVLAAAFGPVLQEDLDGLVNSVLERSVIIDNDVISLVQRFVLNDGLSTGYILAHPRLGEFLRDEFLLRGGWSKRARRAFVDWARGILGALEKGELDPSETPLYLLHFLGRHFDDAKLAPADFMCLAEEGWLRAWESFEDGYRGFSRDIKMVEEVVILQGTENQSLWAWRLRCRLVLLSIASSGSQIPAGLFIECVKKDVLTWRQALYWLERLSDCDRAQVLVELAAYLPDSSLSEALQLAKTVGDDKARAHALTGLAPHLPDLLVEEALQVAEAIWDESARAEALASIGSRLPPSMFNEVLRTVGTVKDKIAQIRVLAGFASQLPQGHLDETLRAAKAIPNEMQRARSLTALASRLEGEKRAPVLREALRAARAITYEGDRASALSALIPSLPPVLIEETYEVVKAIVNDHARVVALSVLAPHLPQALLEDAVQDANSIGDAEMRAQILTFLLAQMPEATRAHALNDALQAARTIGHQWGQALSLATLAAHLPESGREEAFRAAMEVQGDWGRARALTILAPHLPPGLLLEALLAARLIKDNEVRAKPIALIASRLPEMKRAEVFKEALEEVSTIKEEKVRAEALAVLAAHLPQTLIGRALELSTRIVDPEAYAEGFNKIAPLLSPDLLRQALRANRAIGDEKVRANVLAALAAHLPEIERASVLGDALRAAKAVRNEDDLAEVLANLIPELPEALIADAFAAAKRIKNDACRSKVLVVLAPSLPQALIPDALGSPTRL